MRRDPSAATQSKAPINALEYFTNREGFIEAFHRHVETPGGQDLSVLVFYGVGGIGKTTLLRKLCADLAHSEPPLPHVRFNLENVTDQAQSYRDVLMRLRSDLESEFHLKFPNFDLALAVLIAREGGKPPPLVKVSSGLGSVFNAAMEFTPSVVKAGFKLGGDQIRQAVTKSEALEAWVRHVGGTEAVTALNEQFAQDDENILNELIRRFALDLSENLPERPGRACRAVVFLDTYESLWTGRESSLAAQSRQLDLWVRTLTEYLLGAGVLLVIAGRDRISWEDSDPEWASCLDQHLLGGVSAHDAQAFLAKRGIGVAPPLAPDALQAAILRCANTSDAGELPSCHLLALALSADIVMNTRQAGGNPGPGLFQGVPPAKMASELATRFLKSLHNRNLELWVEALSLTPRFDESAALALEAERQLHAGRAGWEQLRRYSFVTAQPDGFFRMHRTMREVLRSRSPQETVMALHTWFEQHWASRGEDALAFYHRWCHDPDETARCWADEHTSAVNALDTSAPRALLTRWSEVALDEDDRALLTSQSWAKTHMILGAALRKTLQIPRAARLTKAMQHFQSALSVFTETDFPSEWAESQAHLGNCSLILPTGDRVENLTQARGCFEAAARVRTEQAMPSEWADLQINLGLTHVYLPTGDKTRNIEEAAKYFESTLRVWTKEAWPLKWAQIQNNLGCNALLLPGGDRAENLRRAAVCFDRVLEVLTIESEPNLWGKAHHNLGIVYTYLPDGDRAENLRRVIWHFEQALRVNTEDGQPDSWAESQNSLGCAWRDMPGDTVAASRRAIEHFRASQRVWTQEDNPERWAQSQYNIAHTLVGLPGENRAADLREAISCARAALKIHTEADFPEQWAKGQETLGRALRAYASETGDANASYEAPPCFAAAVRGYRTVGFAKEAEGAERLLAEC